MVAFAAQGAARSISVPGPSPVLSHLTSARLPNCAAAHCWLSELRALGAASEPVLAVHPAHGVDKHSEVRQMERWAALCWVHPQMAAMHRHLGLPDHLRTAGTLYLEIEAPRCSLSGHPYHAARPLRPQQDSKS